jgi:hypothetical protein
VEARPVTVNREVQQLWCVCQAVHQAASQPVSARKQAPG